MLPCLTMFLPGCALLCPTPESLVKVERVSPPAPLMRPCPGPAFEATTLRQVMQFIVEQDLALDKCDTDKTDMRQWSEGR